ncbi:UDP-galactopyranose mutase [Methylomonas sp. AM2-LC]|uniref:UDP-galactopyranose mutase n=1 Tax=Methylomonas sp. AM2-LC TaxID=3153301 RepID=UPI0032647C99
MEKSLAIVGAGLSGAVIANQLAQAGHQVSVFESRSHIGGNCYTERDKDTGIMLHRYGPHIFHTNNQQTWDFINRFAEFVPFTNRVKAIVNNKVFSLPINLLTINQFFGKTMGPNAAQQYLLSKTDNSITNPISFEEQALRFVGKELYESFFKGYTIKQWGLHPRDLPASILKRIPIRFNYDDNYYNDRYQGLPRNGYTDIVERMLDVPGITVYLNTSFASVDKSDYHHVFQSGPIDAWFNYCCGRLAYRTLDFEIIRSTGDYQGNAVINYCDQVIPYTRITEHKHLAPWEHHEHTVCYKEYSRACGDRDIPYYPLRLSNDSLQFQNYLDLCRQETNVTFVGRLGTYRYLDMDVTITEALAIADNYIKTHS